MKDSEYRGITLQAEPSSLRCVVEMKDQRQPAPLACLCCAAGPAAKKNHWVYIREDKARIKNKRILERTTSFTQETTSWICGRPSVFHFECSVRRRCSEWKGLRRRRQSAAKEHISARSQKSRQRCDSMSKVWCRDIFLVWRLAFIDSNSESYHFYEDSSIVQTFSVSALANPLFKSVW